MSEDWTPEERVAFAAWKVPSPSPDYVNAVLAVVGEGMASSQQIPPADQPLQTPQRASAGSLASARAPSSSSVSLAASSSSVPLAASSSSVPLAASSSSVPLAASSSSVPLAASSSDRVSVVLPASAPLRASSAPSVSSMRRPSTDSAAAAMPLRRQRWGYAGWGVAAATMLAWLASASALQWPAQGEFRGADRSEIVMGSRGVAVSEGKTTLDWSVAWFGAATVHQHSGAVFYRVERGGRFEVVTPAGTVRVRGTCLRVEVNPVKTLQGMALSAAGGAVAATMVTISVYEGTVEVERGDQTMALEAGEQVALGRDGTAVVAAIRPAPSAPPLKTKVNGSPDSSRSESTVGVSAAMKTQKLVEANEALGRQVAALKAEVSALKAKRPEYRPNLATLREMAKECAIAWDMVSVRPDDPETIPDRDVQALDLAASEVEVVNQVYAKYGASMLTQLREVYTEITGDDEVGSLSERAMFAEVLDKVPAAEKRRVYQQVSAERAQLVPPMASPSPFGRLIRLYVSAGDGLERALAAELGEETAQRIRDLNEGFPSRSRMSNGCNGSP